MKKVSKKKVVKKAPRTAIHAKVSPMAYHKLTSLANKKAMTKGQVLNSLLLKAK